MNGPAIRFSVFPNHPEYVKKYFAFFDCDLCGKCCNYFLGVPIDKEDIKRYCEHLKMSVSAFKEKHTEKIGAIITLKHPCQFLKDGQCSIHIARSWNCRMYPLVTAKCTDNIEHLGVRLNCPQAEKALIALEKSLLDYKPVMLPDKNP